MQDLGRSRKPGTAWRRIEIRNDLTGLTALSTLVHESLHQMSHSLSERTVRQLERAIVFLVIDNPDLFKKLLRHAR
jgi:hypothetical protein